MMILMNLLRLLTTLRDVFIEAVAARKAYAAKHPGVSGIE